MTPIEKLIAYTQTQYDRSLLEIPGSGGSPMAAAILEFAKGLPPEQSLLDVARCAVDLKSELDKERRHHEETRVLLYQVGRGDVDSLLLRERDELKAECRRRRVEIDTLRKTNEFNLSRNDQLQEEHQSWLKSADGEIAKLTKERDSLIQTASDDHVFVTEIIQKLRSKFTSDGQAQSKGFIIPTTIDPGHEYLLLCLDGNERQVLRFVKREGEGFPGNVGHHPGTTLQSVIRACINRVEYLDGQIPCDENKHLSSCLNYGLYWLEKRAAERNGLKIPSVHEAFVKDMCLICGHVTCIHDHRPITLPPGWSVGTGDCEGFATRIGGGWNGLSDMEYKWWPLHPDDEWDKQVAPEGCPTCETLIYRRSLRCFEDAQP